MRDLYNEIEKKIQILDFNKLYPGFKPYDFALYNKDGVILKDKVIPFDERFIGNTTIKFENNNIAIWNLDYPVEDVDIFTSKIVHEMFHAFQIDKNEKRFPDEFKGILYDYNEENLSWKFKETQLLVEAYKEESLIKFNNFIGSRKCRSEKHKLLVDYEAGIETIEGMANFTEISVLKQLSLDKMEESIQKLLDYLQKSENYIPIRKISYQIGALIILTAEKLDLKYSKLITDNEEFVYQWFNLNQEFDKDSLDVYDFDNSFIIDYNLRLKKKIEEFILGDFEVISNIKLTGFDPMNTFKYKKYLIFEHFARIKDINSERNIIGFSCAKLDQKNNVVQIYITK
ncbi:hypothetical protein RJI07_02525 [Mycoplasmatota bacterium WC30]